MSEGSRQVGGYAAPAPPSPAPVATIGWAVAAVAITLLIGGANLAGWCVGSPGLRAIMPGWTPMRPLTALALCGWALALAVRIPYGRVPPPPGRRALVWLGSSLAVLAGLNAVLEHLTGRYVTGLDALFYAHQLAQPGAARQMQLGNALGAVLLGWALLVLDARRPAVRRSAGVAAFVVCLLPMLEMVRYLAGGLDDLTVHNTTPVMLDGVGLLALCDATALRAVLPPRDIRSGARAVLPALAVPVFVGNLVEIADALRVIPTQATPLIMTAGTTLLLLALILRIGTQLERADQAAAEALRELAAANEELDAFAYSVAHDLRAPLRSVDGFARLLGEEAGDQLSAEGAAHLCRVRANAARMSALIAALLDLARTGRRPLSRVPVDVTAIARSVADDALTAAVGRRIELTVEPLPPALADPALLEAVFANLVGNAVKFTRPHETARIAVDAYHQEGRVVYRVRDDGVGFEPGHAARLFVPFQRMHGEDEFEGTGIGLAQVRRIVRRHGGEVWADAVPGGGATFCFTLEPPPAHPTGPDPLPPQPRPRCSSTPATAIR